MHRQTLNADGLISLSWFEGNLIDWVNGGKIYFLNQQVKESHQYSPFGFDKSITSDDGQYAFIYKKLGTKGLLLKNGDILREINRSYYFAEAYEYPAAFFTLTGNKTYLIHCPNKYCRLDFEDVETGEIITNIPNRKPSDIFHSRLEVSPDNMYFMSKGWVWHPWDVISPFDIEACIKDPTLLDKNNFIPGFNTEICTASFINDFKILLGASGEPSMDNEEVDALPPGHIGVWDINQKQIYNPVTIDDEFGNLIAINETYAWDLFKYPKVINFSTGKVEQKFEDINTGEQRSSIMSQSDKLPIIAYNRQELKLAIAQNNKIEVLSFTL